MPDHLDSWKYLKTGNYIKAKYTLLLLAHAFFLNCFAFKMVYGVYILTPTASFQQVALASVFSSNKRKL